MHNFKSGDLVKFRHNPVTFTVLAEPELGKLTISAGFGKTLFEVPPHLLEFAEAEIVALARAVA